MIDQFLPSKYLENAVNNISKLPGIGRKTALRLALFILRQDEDYAHKLSESVLELRTKIHYCKKCHTISDTDFCDICANPKRDESIVCVVENIKDVLFIENTQHYRGLYHVLGGVISPIDGITPSDIQIQSLVQRVETEPIKELLFALPATIEGDTTIYYIYKKISHNNIILTTIARGVSVGDELEYTDEATLARSIKDRVPYKV